MKVIDFSSGPPSAALSEHGLDHATVTELPFLLDTSQATSMRGMFQDCASLTDGKVRLIRRDGTKPTNNTYMIRRSGLTREPFFWPDGRPT